MANLTLFTVTGPSRGSIAHWMLEEVGEPYDVHALDRETNEQRQPDYLKINPMGKVPALRHGDVVVTEAAAICLYLAETFPLAGLHVAHRDPLRGQFLKWLFFGPSCIEPAVLDVAFPRKEPAPRGAAVDRDDAAAAGTARRAHRPPARSPSRAVVHSPDPAACRRVVRRSAGWRAGRRPASR